MTAFRMFKNKYKAKAADGFGSKLESAVFGILVTREKLGELKEIKRQQTVVLQDGDRSVRITWRVDFSWIDCKTNEICYTEAKGFETRDYALKLKMWRAKPPAVLEIYKGNYMRPKLVERIERRAA